MLNENGKSIPMIMGCYGIGVNRIIASAIESGHDENGICWPMSLAPFAVLIVALNVRDEAVMATANTLHDELEKRGIEVLLDDRNGRPGFKVKDADLIGIPIRITVGKRGLDDGIVEIKRRTEDQLDKITPDQVVEKVTAMLNA